MTERPGSATALQPQALMVALRDGWSLLNRIERRRAMLLAISIGVNTFLQTVALTGIVPFVQVVMDAELSATSGWMQEVSQRLQLSDPRQLLLIVGVGLLLLVIAKNVYNWFHVRWQSEFGAMCETRLGVDLLRGVLHAPYGFSLTRNSAVIREIVLGHVVHWSRGFLRTVLQLCNDMLFTALVMAVLIYSSPTAGLLICVIASAVAWFMFRTIRPVILRHSEAKRRAIRSASIAATQAVSGVKDVKMTGTESFFENEFAGSFHSYSFADAHLRVWQNIPRLGIEVIGYGALIAFTLAAVGAGAARAEIAGLIALYALAAIRVLPVLTNVVTSLGMLMSALPFISEIRIFVTEMGAGEERHGRHLPLDSWDSITTKNLTYRYAGGQNAALNNVPIVIRRGQSYGIVGPSGAGKSTLFDLLAGLLEPSAGSIELDSRPLEGIDRLRWRLRVGYVAQSPFILDMTLKENITFGIEQANVDESRLARCVEAAHLGDLVAELPDGLDSWIGESGARLSGGQRQRVAIARALYRDVDVLMFDEATSSLDNVSEREIRKTIASLAGKVTIIIIAHRMSTIMDCDKIFVLDKGCLVGEGKYDELLVNCRVFRELAEASRPVHRISAAAGD